MGHHAPHYLFSAEVKKGDCALRVYCAHASTLRVLQHARHVCCLVISNPNRQLHTLAREDFSKRLKLVQTCIKIQRCELKDHFRADVAMNVTSTSEFLIKLVRFEEVRCTRSEAKTCCNHAAKAWKVHRGDIWEGHAGF